MKDFYVYLPSNTDLLHENKASQYVTKLAKELTLGSHWERCLKEIHYPRTWTTLDRDERKFYIHHLNQNTWETLPPGHYESNQQVIDAMNKVLSELMFTLELLATSQNVVFNIPSELGLVYSEPLTLLLGLTHPTEYCRGPRKYGKYLMNLNRGIYAIYVYFDVIQTKLVGDSSVLLLSVVPLRGVFGEMAFKKYSSPVYTPHAKHVFSEIEMYITDSAGRLYHFLLVR